MTLRLPQCPNCHAFHWPVRDVCPVCFTAPPDPVMPWADAPTGGTILSQTSICVSLSPAFANRLPVPITTVALDAGPVVIAFAGAGTAVGARVIVSLEDDNGTPVLKALKPSADAADDGASA